MWLGFKLPGFLSSLKFRGPGLSVSLLIEHPKILNTALQRATGFFSGNPKKIITDSTASRKEIICMYRLFFFPKMKGHISNLYYLLSSTDAKDAKDVLKESIQRLLAKRRLNKVAVTLCTSYVSNLNSFLYCSLYIQEKVHFLCQ